MTADQIAICGLLAVLLAVFALDRYRIEVVALLGLACGLLLGVVPFDRAFAGLSSPAVVTVIEVLLIVRALDRSRLILLVGDRLKRRLGAPGRVGPALCALGAGVSTVMNNIGAFALVLPLAFSLTRSAGVSVRQILMPLSFATLLGGLCTIIGTPANLIVSDALRRAEGAGFRFLDFAPTGLAVTAAGLAVLAFWAPRVFREQGAGDGRGDEAAGRRIVTEVRVLAPATVGGLSVALDGAVHGVERGGRRIFPLRPPSEIGPGDRLLVEADEGALRAEIARGSLALVRAADAGAAASAVEAVVMPDSMLVGSRAATIEAFADQDLRLVAVVTQNPRIEGSLDELRFGIGDVLHIEGNAAALRGFVEDHGLMPLGPVARVAAPAVSLLPVAVFAAGILATALGFLPPEIAFGGVVVLLAVAGHLDLRTALAELNWPIVLLLVAMLPLGEAVATTGAASTIAGALIAALPSATPLAAVATMVALAMLITPFVNNATTAVVLSPIAVEFATEGGVSPALLLMGVAIGASSDFLTPIGHHNNTLAWGLGNYRFRDFPRLGWPVLLAAFGVGVATCVLVWA